MWLAIVCVIGGILAASSFIVSKTPNAKDLIDKVAPYQGWIGVVLTIYGIYNIYFWLVHFNLQLLITSIAMFVVGFLLGYNLISMYLLEKNETAKEKGQQLRAKLSKIQVPAGLALAVLGILVLLGIHF